MPERRCRWPAAWQRWRVVSDLVLPYRGRVIPGTQAGCTGLGQAAGTTLAERSTHTSAKIGANSSKIHRWLSRSVAQDNSIAGNKLDRIFGKSRAWSAQGRTEE